jgi:hypothetical protein
MRRLFLRLAVALATLVIGIGLASVWNAHRTISLCEVEAHPERFEGKTIRFRAALERIVPRLDDGTLIKSDGMRESIDGTSACRFQQLAGAGIEFDPGENPETQIPETTYVRRSETERRYLVDATVVGYLEPDYGGTHCFGYKHIVKHARIERVLSVNEFPNIQDAVKWLESNPR